MAARNPRKIFASPFVITLAACSAPQQPEPQPQPTPPPAPVQPTPTTPTTPGEVIVENPPRPMPGGEAKPSTTFDYEQRWTVMKSGTTCQAMAKVECPKPKKPGDPVPTCNPPPPMKIACPENWDGKEAMNIVQRAKSDKCQVDYPPMKCPKGAMCNPPPPRFVSCPTWQ